MIKDITTCQNCGFPLNHHLYFDGSMKTYKFILLCPVCRFSTNPHFIGNATLEVDYAGDKSGNPDNFTARVSETPIHLEINEEVPWNENKSI